MKFLEAARSAPARYALWYAAVTALAISVLLGLIYSWTTSLLTRHLEEATEHQLSVLLDSYQQDGMPLLLTLAEQEIQRYDQPSIRVVIQEQDGKSLLGNAPDFSPISGWQDIEVIDVSKNPAPQGSVYYRSLGKFLDNGVFILVMHDTTDLKQTQELLIRSFVGALAVTTTMALVGGLLIGDAMLRRVDSVNRTAKAIMKGNLSQRIPTDGRHDELSDLAEHLNSMFSRIQALMEDLRHVSSNIAHDLRSPLGRLRQKLEAALMDPTVSKDDYEQAVSSSIQEVDNLLKTFDAMLRISEIESGPLRDRFLVVSLSQCVENVVDAYTVVAEDEHKQLVSHVASDVEVLGDQELLTQAMVNVVENALRHTPVDSQIEVSLEIHNNRPTLIISDNGPGIPEGERDNVLQRFYRLDNSRTTPGSGLGLSLVKAVITLHNATIRLENADPGLSVIVEFPEQNQPIANYVE